MDKKEVESVVREVLRRTADIKAGQAVPGENHLTAANGGLIRTQMPLALALKLMEKIEAKAAQWNMRVVTAVSDASARPVAVHCMDDSYIASYEIALGKAYTSAALKMATADLKKLAQPGGELYGIQHTNEGKIVIFGGGVPITRDGAVIGGLGISGGSEAQDTALAQYGEKRMKEAADLWQ